MAGEPCYSIVRKPKGFESANEIQLKRHIQSGDVDSCQEAIEELLQNILDGEKFPVNLLMPIINSFEGVNRFSRVKRRDKRIKKLLYILWECLPKRGPDGKFLDQMVIVCGAFDKDLKHPNQYVCGTVLRTLSKTRESEVIRELVHSIEKCLEWSHSYQRKNALLAIANIYKNFPDLNPSATKLIAEHLLKDNDDECKRAALQALLEIAPEEAKPFLHSSNTQDILCMNTSIQLLFVELIQKLFKKGSEEAETYISILTGLVRQSSSPSVRYQAASTLMRASRDPEIVKLVAACFIDICAKDSDNNVKLIALDSLLSLRRIHGSDRVLRNSIMDILFILQSATDSELHEKILTLTLDLISPLNISGVVMALKQELKKMQNANVLSSQQDSVKYRRLLVDTVHKISERFPQAIVEYGIFETLFDLLTSSSIADRTCSKLIVLFRAFMVKNTNYRDVVIKKIHTYFNVSKDHIAIQHGMIQLLGDFSESKEQIEKSYQVIRESLGELPIKQIQKDEEGGNDETGSQSVKGSANGGTETVAKNTNRLVTADGSYAAQSAINYQNATSNEDMHPPLRSYLLKNKFDFVSALCFALLKMACRYQQVESSKPENTKLIAGFMTIVAAIRSLSSSKIQDNEGNKLHISNDHAENLKLALNVLHTLVDDSQIERADLIKKINTEDMRRQLKQVVKNLEMDGAFEIAKKTNKGKRVDENISFSLWESNDDDFNNDTEDHEETQQVSLVDMSNDIPLLGSEDPIYARCQFEVSQYDLGLKIYLENRTGKAQKTFENVCIDLSARRIGDASSIILEKTDPIVLAPKAKVCLSSNVKIISAENRRLFGSISFNDASDSREQAMTFNDIIVDIRDYIRPAEISFDDFRELWRDCEWENKVNITKKHTNLKDYLTHLVTTANMRCVTADRSLKGDCLFLSANLYARSSFGEQALVNVSAEQDEPGGFITGHVKIRSRSQGIALGLGEKIKAS